MGTQRAKVSEPGDKIANILKIVRMLPANIELTDYWSFFTETQQNEMDLSLEEVRESYGVSEPIPFSEVFSIRGNDDLPEGLRSDLKWVEISQQRKALEKCLDGLPIEFASYVLPRESNLRTMFSAYNRRMRLLNLSFEITYEHFILHLANTVEGVVDLKWFEISDAIDRYSDAIYLYKRVYQLLEYIFEFTEGKVVQRFSLFGLNQLFAIKDVTVVDGKLVFLTDPFTEAFNGVPIDRVGECGYCGRAYWIKRLGTAVKGCTRECSTALRTRKWREKTTPEQRQRYKENRIYR